MKLCLMLLLLSAWPLAARNLYTGDPGAETEPDTLTTGIYSSSLLPWTWDSNTAFDGKRSIRIDWDHKKRLFIAAKSKPSQRWFEHWHSLKGPELELGKIYTFSFYAKSSKDKFPVTLLLQSNSGWAYDVAGGISKKKFSLGRDWQRYSITFEAKFHQNAPRKGYTPIFSFIDSPEGTMWYDAVQMEEGNQPTPYQNPAPMRVGVHIGGNMPYNVFGEHENATATIRVAMDAPTKAVLNYRVIDYKGREVEKASRNIAGTDEIILKPDPARLGWYKIIAELTVDGKIIAAHSQNYVKVNSPETTVKGIEPYAGLINAQGMDFFELSRKIGAKRMEVLALWGDFYQSAGIEKVKGEYDFSGLEWMLKRGRETGMLNKVLSMPYIAPDWCYDPKELAEAKASKSSLIPEAGQHQYWVKYIQELMKRYGDSIDEIELGGEDNGKLGINAYYKKKYPEHIKPDAKGSNWLVEGKPFDDLCDMVKLAAAEIRRHYPNMKIGAIRPSQGLSNDDFFFVRAMFRKIGKDFNVFPVDPYFMPYNYGPDVKNHNGTVEDRIPAYQNAKKITRELGIDQPIYISECGMAIDTRFPDESAYRQEQAEGTAKDMIASRVAGYYAYDLFMGFGGGGGAGAYSFHMAQNQRIQPVAAAYSAAARVVENITESQYLKPDRVTRIVPMRKHDGKGVAAIWADNGYMLQSSDLNDPTLKITDLMGNPVTAANGELPLSRAPIYLWHSNYQKLNAMIAKFTVEQTDFCQVKFRMTDRQTGRLKIINNSNTKDLELNLNIDAGNRKIPLAVNVPRGSFCVNIIPVEGKNITVSATRPGIRNAMIFSFGIPELTVIENTEKNIARVELRGDIYPPADPWVTWSGPDDLSADIRASWNADQLNLLFLVKDDQHFNKFQNATYKADSIQVAIDPRNNGEFYIPSEGKPLGPNHLEFGLALGDDGQTYRNISHGRKDIIDEANSQVTRDEKTKITTYRISLSWDKLGVKPHKGMILGMSFIIFDDDTGSGHNYYAPTGAGIAGGKNPAAYKKFILE